MESFTAPTQLDQVYSWNNWTFNNEVDTSLASTNFTFSSSSSSSSAWSSGQAQIPLYVLIFLLAVVGNVMVIVTLVQNKRMRTVTNVFLLNLAVSDLLLGVFCMPFTLIGMLLRQFVFGEALCKAIPYLQAVSVSVSAWTLVAISVERYFAICQPFRSRRWQTLSHAYKTIAAVWAGSLSCMTPIVVLSNLQPVGNPDTGKQKCREAWPSVWLERVFNLLLDLILLIVPLIIMIATYSLITVCLRKGIKMEERRENNESSNLEQTSNRLSNGGSTAEDDEIKDSGSGDVSPRLVHASMKRSAHLRQSNINKTLSNKKRVIKMLFVVVLEFFVSWTPLYVVHTVSLFEPRAVYGTLGIAGISLFQLLAYASSCCNPITYCFMSLSFRRAFIMVFSRCRRKNRWEEESALSVTVPLKTTPSFYRR